MPRCTRCTFIKLSAFHWQSARELNRARRKKERKEEKSGISPTDVSSPPTPFPSIFFVLLSCTKPEPSRETLVLFYAADNERNLLLSFYSSQPQQWTNFMMLAITWKLTRNKRDWDPRRKIVSLFHPPAILSFRAIMLFRLMTLKCKNLSDCFFLLTAKN